MTPLQNPNFQDLKNTVHTINIISIDRQILNNDDFITLFGDGTPLREFTYSADLAKILLFLLEKYDGAHPINVGNTQERSIKEVAEILCDVLKFDGNVVWDDTKPAGQHKKPSDNSKLIDIGWRKEEYSDFYNSIENVCNWFQKQYPDIRGY